MFSLIAVLLGQAAASAAAPTVPPPPAFTLRVTVERRDEHVTYHFADPSSIDTTALVPHYFEQRYDTTNTWLGLAADYRLGRQPAETTVAIAPRRTTAGSDLDTFFDPSGDVVVSGTDGAVDLGSVALTERLAVATWHGWAVGVALGYRRSRADFLPDFIILTHTSPPSTTRTYTTARETTIAQVIESGFAADRRWALANRWALRASLSLLPLTVGRLEVQLPDKTPPLDTTAQAVSFGARGEASVARAFGAVSAGVGGSFEGIWAYQATSAYRGHGLGVEAFLGVGR